MTGGADAHQSGVKGMFARLARRYDLVNTLASLGLDRRWRRAAVDAAALDGGGDVLDVCAGTGEMTMALAGRLDRGRVVGLDISPEMLAVAVHKAAALQARRGEGASSGPDFLAGDALDLPFAAASFDVVTIAFGVRNVPDRAGIFREAWRVLRPNGRLVVLEFTRPPGLSLRALHRVYLRTVVPLVGGLLTGDVASYRYLGRTIAGFPEPAVLAGEMAAAGFASVRWRYLSGGIVALHVGIRD